MGEFPTQKQEMTREKAIKEYVIPALMHTWNEKINKEVLEALEQESTTKNDLGVDCISRKAVLDAIDSKAWEFCDYLISKGRNDEQRPVSHFADNVRECVREELPSVTPQEPCDKCEVGNPCLYCKHEFEAKTGNWYRQTNDYVDYYECSECGMAMGLYNVKNYCPNCGSRNEVEE